MGSERMILLRACAGAPPLAVPIGTRTIRTLLAIEANPCVGLDVIADELDSSRMCVHRDRVILEDLGFVVRERYQQGTFRSALRMVAGSSMLRPMLPT